MSDKKTTTIIIPAIMVSALVKKFIENLQSSGRVIRQQLLVKPAYLTDNKEEKRRILAMKKTKEALESEEKADAIAQAAVRAMEARNIDIPASGDIKVPESIYSDIVRNLNNTGFFDFLLTEEGLTKRAALRGVIDERREEREKRKAEKEKPKPTEPQPTEEDVELSDGMESLKRIAEEMQKKAPELIKAKTKPKKKKISSGSDTVAAVAPDSGTDASDRSVYDILTERERSTAPVNISSDSGDLSEVVEDEKINMNINRMKYETNIDYLTRLQKIQKIKLELPEDINIGDTLLLSQIIIKTTKQIQKNQMAKSKRATEIQQKKDLLQDQQENLERMARNATAERQSIAEQQRSRLEEIAEEATREREQLRNDFSRLMEINPELKTLAINVIQKLKEKPELKDITTKETKKKYPIKKIANVSDKDVKTLIDTIPADYRPTLGPVVRNLLAGGDMDANTIVAGIVGVGLSLGTGSSVAGTIGATVFNSLRETTGFNFNNMFQPALPPPSTTGIGDLSEPTGLDRKTDREQKHSAILDLTFESGDDPEFEQDFSNIPYSDAGGLPGPPNPEEEKKGFDTLVEDVSDQLREMNPDAPESRIRGWAMKYLNSKTPSQIKRLISLALVATTGALRAIESRVAEPFKNSVKYLSGMDDEDARIVIRNIGIVRNALKSDVKKISTKIRNVPPLVRPRRSDIDIGVGAGSLSTATASGISTGSAMGALSGVVPGMLGGAVAGGVSASALRTYYRSQGVPDSPELEKKIGYLTMLPVSVLGAYLGYTPSGKPDEVMGTGVVSGAGITEKKIDVDPKVLTETQAQLDQEESKNKQWIPKAIQPSTAILDQSQQERYADDLEFVAFNYIAPTSEGAQGDIYTNPLKRQQFAGNEIRYTNAGVFVPYDTWNEINDTNDISEQRIREMALGQKPLVPLPDMRFVPQDNETTFENMAEYHYVNGEDTAIEYKSPYSDYSDVRNYWSINESSELFTIDQ